MKKKESYKSIRNKAYKKYKGLSSSDAGYSQYDPAPSNLPAGITAPKGAIINQGRGNFHVTSSNIGGGTLAMTDKGDFVGAGGPTGALNNPGETKYIPAWSQGQGGGATSRGALTKKRSMKSKKANKRQKKHGKKR